MQLNDEQKNQVRQWIAGGASLSQVQDRIRQEFQISLSYLDTRFLVADLNVTPQDKPAPVEKIATEKSDEPSPMSAAEDASVFDETESPAGSGGVSVSIDEVTAPYALLSGKVTFSDGTCADWFVDEMGRLGMNPSKPGYRPSQADFVAFQRELEKLATSRGL